MTENYGAVVDAVVASDADAEPEPYSMETYELTSIMINGIGSGAVTDRSSMTEHLTGFDGHGSTRHYSWDDRGDLTDPDVWVPEVA